jgi:hypothetical protein
MPSYKRKKQVRERYGNICDRTVDGWVQSGRLPPPHYFAGSPFPFWNEDELDAADQAALDTTRSGSLRERMTEIGAIGRAAQIATDQENGGTEGGDGAAAIPGVSCQRQHGDERWRK